MLRESSSTFFLDWSSGLLLMDMNSL